MTARISGPMPPLRSTDDAHNGGALQSHFFLWRLPLYLRAVLRVLP